MAVRIISGIAVDVRRKRVKNLNLRVTQSCEVILSVPMNTSDRRIEEFIESKRDWIEKALMKFKDSSNDSDQWFAEGGRIAVLGTTYPVTEKVGTRPSCEIKDGCAVLTFPPGYSYEDREDYMKEWYRSVLKSVVPDMLAHIEGRTGLHCSAWSTRQMTTKWGTCNCSTKKIWLSVRLAEKPEMCIEYVIMHELAHTEVPNHGAAFKAIMDRYMPDWPERKRMLNYGVRSS